MLMNVKLFSCDAIDYSKKIDLYSNKKYADRKQAKLAYKAYKYG